MGKLIEQEKRINTTVADEVVAVPFPGQGYLQKLSVVRVGGGNIAVDVYNRAFTSSSYEGELTSPLNYDVNDRTQINPDGSKIMFTSLAPVLVREGDNVKISAPSTGYDELNVEVVKVSQDNKKILLLTNSLDLPKLKASVQLDIPTTDWPLYQIIPQQSGSDSLSYFPELDGGRVSYHNRDVINPAYNIGIIRKLYVSFAEPGDYKVSIGAEEGTA